MNEKGVKWVVQVEMILLDVLFSVQNCSISGWFLCEFTKVTRWVTLQFI